MAKTAKKIPPIKMSTTLYTIPMGSDWDIEIIEIPDPAGDLLRIGTTSESKTFSGITFPANRLDQVIKALQAVKQSRRQKAMS